MKFAFLKKGEREPQKMNSIEFCICSAKLHLKVTYPNNRSIIHRKDQKCNYRQKQSKNYIVKYNIIKYISIVF